MRILVSACLLGLATRFDGGHCLRPALEALARQHTLIPLCPEQLGGLPTPRPPCEIQAGRVRSQAGHDLTDAYERGARQCLDLFYRLGCDAAILKARSPSCGIGSIYDGSFSDKLVPGQGVLAALLHQQGIPLYDEDSCTALLSE